MTDEEVINVLAKRLGWSPINLGGVVVYRCDGHEPYEQDLLGSRDALAPLLGKLTGDEWRDLGTNLQGGYASLIYSEGDLKFLLTISARELAHAIAEVIK